MHTLRSSRSLVPALAIVLFVVGACASGASATGGPASSPSPSSGPVTTGEDAFARIVATEPRLAGIMPRDPELIGQATWYEAEPAGDGFSVETYVGWGDCMAGCIGHHVWTWSVSRDGTVVLVAEEGDPVPADEWPSPGGTGRTGILGTALAGPTCPVEQPGDPSCAPRPVAGATVVIRDGQGAEVGTAVTGPTGQFFAELPPGLYTVEARPVEGLMGFPGPIEVEVTESEATVELAYDTGIR